MSGMPSDYPATTAPSPPGEPETLSPASQPSPYGRGAPKPKGSPFGDNAKRGGGALAALLAVLAKFKGVLFFLPKLKLLATAFVSFGAYALIWGWKFGLGVVLLILLHEMGHFIQYRFEGVKASAPVFIPFVGAYVVGDALPDRPFAAARVALAGPILGSLGALALVPIYHSTGDPLWRALAFFGFFINLVNLVPVRQLDGGHATQDLPRGAMLVILAVTIGLLFVFPGIVILGLAVVTAYRLWKRFRPLDAHDGSPVRTPLRPLQQAIVAATYLGLVITLAYAAHATELVRHFSDA